MNAQESIEKIEQELAQIDNLIDDRNRLERAGYISEEQRIVDEAEYNEMKTALSIVLESAKLFHEIAMPVPLYDNVEMKLEYENRWLDRKEVEAIGLEFNYLKEENK